MQLICLEARRAGEFLSHAASLLEILDHVLRAEHGTDLDRLRSLNPRELFATAHDLALKVLDHFAVVASDFFRGGPEIARIALLDVANAAETAESEFESDHHAAPWSSKS